jgi:transcriptional regulator with XRE-family HTH domain
MKRGKYDDDRLVELIARGQMSYAEIGQAVGLSEGYVGQIARGQHRPELQPRIEAISRGFLLEARMVGRRWARGLLSRHIRIGLDGEGETARKCREFVMTRFLGKSDVEDAPTHRPLPGLSEEELELIAQMKDGPES